MLSHLVVSDSATPWMVARQAPLSIGFSRQEYWSGLPFLSPGDLPDLGIEPVSSALQVDSLPLSFTPGKLYLWLPWAKLTISSIKMHFTCTGTILEI